MSVSNALRQRIKPSWPAHYKLTIETALRAHDNLASARAKINGDAELSAQGRVSRLQKYVTQHSGPALANAMRSLHLERGKIKAKKASIVAKATDLDADAFGAEIRVAIRSMSQGEAAALLIGANADPRAQKAVLAAPRFLTGLSQEVYSRVESDHLATSHASDLADVAEAEEALSTAEAAVGILRANLVESTGMQEAAFDQWLDSTYAPTKIDSHAENDEVAFYMNGEPVYYKRQ